VAQAKPVRQSWEDDAMTPTITPFEIKVPQSELDDLKTRLALTRWTDRETVDDWSQGAPLAKVKALVDRWQGAYDWRRCEAMLNGFGSWRAQFDEIGVHFLHKRSPHPNALPLLLTHGWPGSVVEFAGVIGPLTDPVAHGGRAEDAFDVIVPALPGYGFSDKPTKTGWNPAKIAETWISLMRALDYPRWVAQGGDWGAVVTALIGGLAPPECAAIHLNMVPLPPGATKSDDLTPQEQAALDAMVKHRSEGTGYSTQQASRPQTLGYGLVDSPVGQAAWIYEKFHEWADCGGEPESVLSHDQMLDNIMLYWLTGAGTSSGRLYWEKSGRADRPKVQIPVGVSVFPGEIFMPSRRWAEAGYANIVYWNELQKGGHFAAFEQPKLFVEEMRACFRPLR
jgi:pimeloyl-ACP methyl ester carboxylesterase